MFRYETRCFSTNPTFPNRLLQGGRAVAREGARGEGVPLQGRGQGRGGKGVRVTVISTGGEVARRLLLPVGEAKQRSRQAWVISSRPAQSGTHTGEGGRLKSVSVGFRPSPRLHSRRPSFNLLPVKAGRTQNENERSAVAIPHPALIRRMPALRHRSCFLALPNTSWGWAGLGWAGPRAWRWVCCAVRCGRTGSRRPAAQQAPTMVP